MGNQQAVQTSPCLARQQEETEHIYTYSRKAQARTSLACVLVEKMATTHNGDGLESGEREGAKDPTKLGGCIPLRSRGRINHQQRTREKLGSGVDTATNDIACSQR